MCLVVIERVTTIKIYFTVLGFAMHCCPCSQQRFVNTQTSFSYNDSRPFLTTVVPSPDSQSFGQTLDLLFGYHTALIQLKT